MVWTFDGVVLPAGHTSRLDIGDHNPSIDGELPGRYALPGLTDAHAHLTVRSDHTLGHESLALQRLQEYAEAGIATVRDTGGRSEVTLRIAASDEPGLPTVFAAGRFLAPAARYFPGMHEPVEAEDLLSAAGREIASGATWLKLIGDFPLLDQGGRPVPGSLAPTYDLETVRHAVAFAHSRGVRVAVHTQSRRVDELVLAGVDSVEHGEWISEDAVDALGARGGAWTPTLAAITDAPDHATAKRMTMRPRLLNGCTCCCPVPWRQACECWPGPTTRPALRTRSRCYRVTGSPRRRRWRQEAPKLPSPVHHLS